MSANPSPVAVALYDARPFFEKALQHGIEHGIIDAQKLSLICAEAPKGMVQIARYFGSEFLRPELEKARERMVNLVSLYLEASCNGDLLRAAESLRDHSFLSRSKGGSDMLKTLIAMPQNSHFGMHENTGFTDDHIPLLAKWSLRSLADYQAEWDRRSQVVQVVDAAAWLAGQLGMDADDLADAGKDAEAVIRTALLVLATGRTEMPDWADLEKMIAALRKKYGTVKSSGKPLSLAIKTPKPMPAHLQGTVDSLGHSVVADLPTLLDARLPARQLFDQTPSFMGRYFWIEDALSEVDHHDRKTSAAWQKATGGLTDDGSLLTLLLRVAAGASPKTLLSQKGAATLIRKIQKTGLDPALARQYILTHAPAQYQPDYIRLWSDFIADAQHTLQSDSFSSLQDALALLRLECNVA